MNSSRTLTLVCDVVRVVEEQLELSLPELCQRGGIDHKPALELVAHGLLDPVGHGPEEWRFPGPSLARTRRAQRLIDDLGVNAAGAVIVIELLERLDRLQRLQAR